MTFLTPAAAAALAGCATPEEIASNLWNRGTSGDVIARTSETLPFPPTVHTALPSQGVVRRMVSPPHSGAAAAPERRGGTAVERRWAGALRLGARYGRGW